MRDDFSFENRVRRPPRSVREPASWPASQDADRPGCSPGRPRHDHANLPARTAPTGSVFLEPGVLSCLFKAAGSQSFTLFELLISVRRVPAQIRGRQNTATTTMMKLRRAKKDSLMSNSICPQGAIGGWCRPPRMQSSAERSGFIPLNFKKPRSASDSREGFTASLRTGRRAPQRHSRGSSRIDHPGRTTKLSAKRPVAASLIVWRDSQSVSEPPSKPLIV